MLSLQGTKGKIIIRTPSTFFQAFLELLELFLLPEVVLFSDISPLVPESKLTFP